MTRTINAPMPGVISAVLLQPGDLFKKGQELIILEAMKMENVLSAEKAGVVASIPVSEGDSLAVDDTIMVFER